MPPPPPRPQFYYFVAARYCSYSGNNRVCIGSILTSEAVQTEPSTGLPLTWVDTALERLEDEAGGAAKGEAAEKAVQAETPEQPEQPEQPEEGKAEEDDGGGKEAARNQIK